MSYNNNPSSALRRRIIGKTENAERGKCEREVGGQRNCVNAQFPPAAAAIIPASGDFRKNASQPQSSANANVNANEPEKRATKSR
jgi:hypothetical protein